MTQHPALAAAASLSNHAHRRHTAHERKIIKLTLELKESKRQEALTHEALHDWRCAAATYYTTLEYLETLLPKLLADCHSPAAVIDQALEFITKVKSGENILTASLDQTPHRPSVPSVVKNQLLLSQGSAT